MGGTYARKCVSSDESIQSPTDYRQTRGLNRRTQAFARNLQWRSQDILILRISRDCNSASSSHVALLCLPHGTARLKGSLQPTQASPIFSCTSLYKAEDADTLSLLGHCALPTDRSIDLKSRRITYSASTRKAIGVQQLPNTMLAAPKQSPS